MQRVKKAAGSRSPHGTISRYTSGCSCFECRLAWAEHSRLRRAGVTLWVDAAPVRRHLQYLKWHGLTLREIARRAPEVVYETVRNVYEGRVKKVRRDTADALLGVARGRREAA